MFFFTAIGILYLVATLICAVLTITGSNSGRVEKRSFLLALLAPIVAIVGFILIISSAIHYLRDVISDGGFILHYRKKKNKKKYCCPIKIGIVYYSFETAFEQANLFLVSKSNPSYVGRSSNCRIF